MTYSIAARDRETGELGVAVQSQSFNTGAGVPWARAGVGAVATQSFTDRRYGWRGLELLAEQVEPAVVLERLRAEDELPEFRQVGLVDARGRVAQWTGAQCVPDAGSAAGEGWAAQANMVASPRVWEAMGEAFVAARGSLAQRLLAALDAAEAEGGDWRGRGGAAIVVVASEGEPWERVIDLRVEEGDDSLARLRELVDRAEAYRRWNRASEGHVEITAGGGLSRPHVLWSPILDALAASDVLLARRLFEELVAEEPRWRDYARTLDAHPHLPSLAALLQPSRIVVVPDRLYFTDDDEANELVARDPLAFLVGLALDQQVTVQKAFAGPLAIKRRLGRFDAETLAGTDLEPVFREKPAIHRFPGSMAERVRDLAAHLVERYGGDAARVWTDAKTPEELKANLSALPGFGEMKVRTAAAVLAKRFGVANAAPLVPSHPTLGDVDSAQALADYQAAKRAHKAELRARNA